MPLTHKGPLKIRGGETYCHYRRPRAALACRSSEQAKRQSTEKAQHLHADSRSLWLLLLACGCCIPGITTG